MNHDLRTRIANIGCDGTEVLALHGVECGKATGGNVKIRCPRPDHEDHDPSCSVELSSGRAHCFGCGTIASDAVGLHHALGDFSSMTEALEDLEARHGITRPQFDGPPPPLLNSETASAKPQGSPRTVATWTYSRADGSPAFEVHRKQRLQPDGSWWKKPGSSKPWKEFRQTHPGGAPANLPAEYRQEGARPLYELPTIMAGLESATVVIVEGEKAADALAPLGAVVTTSSGGASAARKTDWSPLAGRSVVIWPDHDDAGRNYAAVVATALGQLAPRPRVRVIDTARLKLPEAGDAADWVAAGGTQADLDRLISEASEPMIEAGGDDGWDDPVPFDEYEVPAFPLELLPAWLREWTEAQAIALQTPQDLPGMLGLAMVSVATAKKYVIELKPGWQESINIYALVIANPSEKKSPAFRAAWRPIAEFEAEEQRRVAPEIQAAESARKILELQLQNQERDAARAKNASESDQHRANAEATAREIASSRPPVLPRLFTDNATAEALEQRIIQQGGRFAVLAPEGGIFDVMAGRYASDSGRRGNIDALLKAYSGDPLRIDRIGRDGGSVESAILTVALTVQPAVLEDIARNPSFDAKGLPARFWYSLPASLVGRREPDPAPVSRFIHDAYRTKLRSLLEIAPEISEERELVSRPIQLSQGARELFFGFVAEIEPRRGEGGDLSGPGIGFWAGKIDGGLARVAGLFHVGDLAGRYPGQDLAERIASTPISRETMKRAIEFGAAYLIPQAQAAFGRMRSDPASAGAQFVLACLERDGRRELSERDIHRLTRSRLQRVKDLRPVLEVLVEHGYLRPGPPPQGGNPGRKPSPVFEVHPGLDTLDRMDRTRKTSGDGGSSVQSVHSVQRVEGEERAHEGAQVSGPSGPVSGAEAVA